MRAYCISLPDRPKKWQRASAQIRAKGFEVELYSAHKRNPGWVGCTESHLGALASIGTAPFAIFEDDVEFIEQIHFMEQAIAQIGEFDMLFLGCDPQEPMKRVSENALKIGKVYQTHAIVYGSNKVVDYILANRNSIRKIDVFFAEEIIPKFKCYATYPMLCKQADGFSDIQNRSLDFSYIVDKFNKMVQK